jgi:rhodanese-related sulfurtransferase
MNTRKVRLAFSFVVSVCVVVFHQGILVIGQAPVKGAGVAFVSAEELKTKLAANEPVVVIDVRSSEKYADSNQKIKGAIHYKVRRLNHRVSFPPLKDARDREVVTYCSCPADESAIAAARILLEKGFKHVRVLKGGWTEWVKISGQTEPKPRGL